MQSACFWSKILHLIQLSYSSSLRWHKQLEVISVVHFRVYIYIYVWGHAVAQLVEALRCKPEGRGIDSRWCHWNFSLTQSFRLHYGPGATQPVTEMSTRNISRG